MKKAFIGVLRKKAGDYLFNWWGCFYEAEITIASQKENFNVIRKWYQPQSPYSLHIAIAPTKIIIDLSGFWKARNWDRWSNSIICMQA